ncbi:unknown [Clostridium sp. CAG:356]|nr:unknown [Clostridium sp. CAG:356]
MNNFREVNDDILKDWLDFRGEDLCSLTCEEDKKHHIYFDEISERILKRVPKNDRKYVEKQLSFLDDNFLDYLGYWNEKYYRNGFVDAIQLIMGCFEE